MKQKSVHLLKQLALLTLDHKDPGSNPTRGEVLLLSTCTLCFYREIKKCLSGSLWL